MDIDIVVRAAKQEDLDEAESLYNALNDYLAVHENYPRWKKGYTRCGSMHRRGFVPKACM